MSGINNLLNKKKGQEPKVEIGKTFQSGIRFTPETKKLLNKIKRYYEDLYEEDPDFKKKHNLKRKPTQDFVISEALPLLANKLKIEF